MKELKTNAIKFYDVKTIVFFVNNYFPILWQYSIEKLLPKFITTSGHRVISTSRYHTITNRWLDLEKNPLNSRWYCQFVNYKSWKFSKSIQLFASYKWQSQLNTFIKEAYGHMALISLSLKLLLSVISLEDRCIFSCLSLQYWKSEQNNKTYLCHYILSFITWILLKICFFAQNEFYYKYSFYQI